MRPVDSKEFLECQHCGLRFRSERMLKVHKSTVCEYDIVPKPEDVIAVVPCTCFSGPCAQHEGDEG